MITSATISPCGLYRYRLGRRWEADGTTLLFIMLNPSTADASVDDPTIRRCIGFGRKLGHRAIDVVNLFAFRSTQPRVLVTAQDPIGPDNNKHIFQAIGSASAVICAWGAFAYTKPELRRRARVVTTMVPTDRTWALGITAQGAPAHPLYLRADAVLRRFPISEGKLSDVRGA